MRPGGRSTRTSFTLPSGIGSVVTGSVVWLNWMVGVAWKGWLPAWVAGEPSWLVTDPSNDAIPKEADAGAATAARRPTATTEPVRTERIAREIDSVIGSPSSWSA